MKNFLLPAVCILTFNLQLLTFNCFAQYTKLYDFAGTANGSNPNGDLISVGAFLYGMTNTGGANNKGTIFKIKPDGTGYSKLLDFAGANGAYPTGSLFSDGTFLYGMTVNGGTYSFGTVFKIMPNGTGYAKLMDMDTANANGSYPNGNLISDGTFLYGMTYGGGINVLGTIFKIMPNGTGYSKLLDFAGTANGSKPYGTLFYDGTFLYGMTNQGGANNMGVVFKIKPNGTGYANLLDFAGANGAYPTTGTLISDGTFLYGMTLSGGTNSSGNIFKIKPDGSGYLNLLDFNNTNGSFPWGSLVAGGTFLYGMTYQGGAVGIDSGTVFKIKPDGTGYLNLFNFNCPVGNHFYGSRPYGSLISVGGILYGMTSKGGANDDGVIFKLYDISVSAAMVGNPICLNQCNGSASTSVTGGTSPFTYSWSTSPVQTTATATGLCATTYTVTVSDMNGSASNTITIASLSEPTAPSICAITVDSLSQYNDIFWDKTPYINTSADSFIVYRYDVISTHYLRIGAVSKNSLSMFTDTAFGIGGPNGGNPKISSWKYRLAVRDTCGNISAKSPCVKSIFIQANGANFSWTAYVDSANVNLPTGYSFKRDDNNTGNWHVIANVASTSTTDPNYTSYPNGNWRVDALGFNCMAAIVNPKNPYTNTISLNSSRSNVYRVGIGGVNEINNTINISVSPNPNNGSFTIQMDNGQLSINNYQLSIYTLLGEKVYEKLSIINSPLSINLSEAKNGIYFLQLKTSEGIATKKIVINK